MSKDFSTSEELPRVNFVKYAVLTKYANDMNNEPQDWQLRENSPGDSPRYESLTPSRFTNFY